jgi:Tfp pilus assembly protein PilV
VEAAITKEVFQTMKCTKEKLVKTRYNKLEKPGWEQGFTLLETTIAMVIMMVVGLGAASLFFFSVTNNTGARDRQLMMAVAQQQIETLRSATFANINSTVTNNGGTDKTVTSAGRQYRVRTTVADTTASLKTITVLVTPRGTGPVWGNTSSNYGGVVLMMQRATSTLGPNR